jgi:hypothetical protein
MKLSIFQDYSDNIAETKEFTFRSKTSEGTMETKLLDDEVELLKQLQQRIIIRARKWQVA